MLKTMRANAGSWIIKFLLLAIVVVFVFWGVGSFRSQKNTRLAVVDNETISWDEFNKAYMSMRENLKYQFGGKLDEDMLQMLNIKEQVLNELIHTKLLVAEARRLDLDVTPEELAETIRKMPYFQTDGKFDNNRYRMILNASRMTPEEFEAQQTDVLLVSKLRTLILSTVKVSDNEALEWFQYNQASVNIDYALFSPNSYKDIRPSDEDVQSYFEENKDTYRTQPMVKAQYFRFSPGEYRSKVSVNKEAIESYYNENKESFLEPKTVEARHILIKLPQDPSAEIVEAKRKEAEKIMKMAKEGKDFAELAKTHSEGPSKSNGGYLGSFQKEQMVAPFSEAAFSMNAGDISEPVQTQFGWHIIKVEKVNLEKQKTLEEAAPEIEKTLAQKQEETLAANDADMVYDLSYDSDDLKAISESKGFKLWTTEFFTKTGPANISQPAKFADIAFSLETNEISDIETIGSDFYVIQVIDEKPAEIPKLETVKASVTEDVTKKMQNEKAKQEADKVLALLAAPEEDSQAVADDIKFTATGFFKRNDTIPTIGYEKSIADAAFLLTSNNPFPENVLKGSKGYYIIRFKERKTPEKEAFLLEKEDIIDKLIKTKQTSAFNALVEDLKEKSDITIADAFYKT